MLDRFHSQFQMFSELSLIFCLLANTGEADSDVKGPKNQAFLCVAVMCFNSFFNDTVGRNSAPVEVGNLSRYLRGFKNIPPVVFFAGFLPSSPQAPPHGFERLVGNFS